MRQWNVNPKILCRKHLLGEHVECHMVVGSILKGRSIKRFVEDGLINVHHIKSRHSELVNEMKARGYNHKSELPEFNEWVAGCVDPKKNIKELIRRCPECKKRIENI